MTEQVIAMVGLGTRTLQNGSIHTIACAVAYFTGLQWHIGGLGLSPSVCFPHEFIGLRLEAMRLVL
jgi:hypothetical protein